MLTISENKHDTGLAFLIWLFVVLKVVEKTTTLILGDIVLWYMTNLITVNSGQFKISKS